MLLLLGAPAARAQTGAPDAPPLGVWTDEQGETQVELYRCGEQLCGRIVQLLHGTDAEGKPRLDVHNPDPKRRTQPHVGLTIIQDLHFNPDEKRWDGGQIYDPDNGRTYSCYVRPLTGDRLEVKGYIGFALVGRAQVWKRVR
ncbi:hypothetical protein B0919_04625 [Hymenobacter sp. CRA2]|nr:hypothetical protein B0919_04625 [Hymenobacter sp. CRA2]